LVIERDPRPVLAIETPPDKDNGENNDYTNALAERGRVRAQKKELTKTEAVAKAVFLVLCTVM
jgi:hypothetical protein